MHSCVYLYIRRLLERSSVWEQTDKLNFNNKSLTSTRIVLQNASVELDFNNDDDSLLKQVASCIPDYRANEFKGSAAAAVAHKYVLHM